MTISFRYTIRDYLAFNFYHVFRSPVFLGLLAIFLIIGIKPNWESVGRLASDDSTLFKIIFFVVLELVPVVIMILGVGFALVVSSFGKMNKTVYTDCSITLGNESILSESKYSRTELKWASVQKVRRSRNHIFLYVMQHGAVTIPRHAFLNEVAWNQFFDECQTRIKRGGSED